MNDPSLRELLEQSVREVSADPAAGDDAWARARRESRRQQWLVAVAASLAVVVVVGVVAWPRDGDRSAPPVTVPTTTERTSEASPADLHAEYVERWQRLSGPAWEDGQVDALPRIATSLPDVIDPFGAEAASLADDPVVSAVAVAQPWDALDVRVLGDDGRWRVIDTSGLKATFSEGVANSLIEGRPISPDGTTLAIAQPGSLVLVDLTTGSRQRVDVPQDDYPTWVERMTQWSPDGAAVLIGTGHTSEGNGSWLVDVTSGSVVAAPYHAVASSFGPDGTVYELADACGFCEVRRYAGVDRIDTLRLEAELYVVRPAVGESMAVARAVRSWSGPKRLPANSDGLLVVDPDDGEPVAFMPMRNLHQVESADLLGWLDDDTVVFSVFVHTAAGPSDVLAAWNHATGVVSLLADPWPDGGFRVGFAVDRL